MAPIPVSERSKTYTPVNQAGPFPIDFPLFDESGADLFVTLNDVEVSGWTFSGTLESGFYGAPNTWINGSILFAQPITGTLVIDGDRAPRREGQFAEGRGVPARDLNAELNTLVASAQEARRDIKAAKAALSEFSADIAAALEARQAAENARDDVRQKYLGEFDFFPEASDLGFPIVDGALFSLADQPDPNDDGLYVRRGGDWHSIFDVPVFDVRAAVIVGTREDMADLPTLIFKAANLSGEGGRNGLFVWNATDLSALVTVDPAQGVYVPPASDPTGASGAWVREFDGAAVHDVWFGVVRGNVGATSGPDMRAPMQAALDFCRARGLDLLLSRGSVFVSQNGSNAYCLLNEGVSMIGLPAKSTYSVIAPMPTVPSNADIIRFRPRANQDQDFIQFTRFMVNPNQSGTAYGKRAFYMLTDNICNVGQMLFSRMYCGAGNDYSLYFENSIPTNAQGNPSNTVISECSFFEGIYLLGAGDNVSVRDSFIITGVGSARHGVYVYQVDGGGGVASFALIERNAMNANGSAILVDRARNLRIRDNNIEHSAGAGVNASVINLRGSGGQLSMPIVEGNAIGIFGASTAQVGVNVGTCFFAQVAENNIITDAVRSHAIAVGSSSTNTRISRNKVSPEWTNNVTDSGAGTTATDFVESGI